MLPIVVVVTLAVVVTVVVIMSMAVVTKVITIRNLLQLPRATFSSVDHRPEVPSLLESLDATLRMPSVAPWLISSLQEP